VILITRVLCKFWIKDSSEWPELGNNSRNFALSESLKRHVFLNLSKRIRSFRLHPSQTNSRARSSSSSSRVGFTVNNGALARGTYLVYKRQRCISVSCSSSLKNGFSFHHQDISITKYREIVVVTPVNGSQFLSGGNFIERGPMYCDR